MTMRTTFLWLGLLLLLTTRQAGAAGADKPSLDEGSPRRRLLQDIDITPTGGDGRTFIRIKVGTEVAVGAVTRAGVRYTVPDPCFQVTGTCPEEQLGPVFTGNTPLRKYGSLVVEHDCLITKPALLYADPGLKKVLAATSAIAPMLAVDRADKVVLVVYRTPELEVQGWVPDSRVLAPAAFRVHDRESILWYLRFWHNTVDDVRKMFANVGEEDVVDSILLELFRNSSAYEFDKIVDVVNAAKPTPFSRGLLTRFAEKIRWTNYLSEYPIRLARLEAARQSEWGDVPFLEHQLQRNFKNVEVTYTYYDTVTEYKRISRNGGPIERVAEDIKIPREATRWEEQPLNPAERAQLQTKVDTYKKQEAVWQQVRKTVLDLDQALYDRYAVALLNVDGFSSYLDELIALGTPENRVSR